jgi:hypothetical protein
MAGKAGVMISGKGPDEGMKKKACGRLKATIVTIQANQLYSELRLVGDFSASGYFQRDI